MLSLKPRPFVQSFFDVQTPRQQPQVFLCFFPFVYLEMPHCPSIFVPLLVPLCMSYGEYGVRYVFSFRMVFLKKNQTTPIDLLSISIPRDHGLDFFTSAYVRIQCINQIRRGMRQ